MACFPFSCQLFLLNLTPPSGSMFGGIHIMKFEDFLMQPSDQKKQKRAELEEEVEKLQCELDAELKLNEVLTCALQGPVLSRPCLHILVPSKVQVLLAELATVEREIVSLEREVDELKISLYEEKHSREWEDMLRWQPRRHRHGRQQQQHCSYRASRERRAYAGSAIDVQSLSAIKFDGSISEASTCSGRSQLRDQVDSEIGIQKPNELSQELIKCLIGIFLNHNLTSPSSKGSAIVPKHTLSCMSSKGFISKTSLINCKAPTFLVDNTSSIDHPYGILPDFNGTVRDVGPYKNCIQITRSSLDTSRVSQCFQAMGKLRILVHKLSNVDLTLLTYKQKLAFWINIYNACIMHAFLEHGLPSTQERLLVLMNKAAVNVGGIILNALAIEHFILRCPSVAANGHTDEKEGLLRRAYGLGYPEPNVTFALCRGSWSSPALRVYTPDEVVDQLGRARVEYLEAAVGVTSKKKVVVPKLLQWHMRDFADDMESLLEWIYSQLPNSGTLKRLMMECLVGETKSPLSRMVEIQPYDSEFRYLLLL